MKALTSRLRLLRTLKPAGVPVVGALALALLAEKLVPAATAVALSLLVGQLDGTAGTALFTLLLLPLGAFGAVLILGHVAEAVTEPLVFVASARIDGEHRKQVALTASTSTRLDALERPEVQVLLREALADRSRGYDCTPADGAIGQMRWGAAMLGAAAVCVVLAQYAWWLVPLLLIPAGLNRLLRTRDEFALSRVWRGATKGELFADVWRNAATSPGEGKDVRIFGFADWMIARMQGHIREANAPLWDYITGMVRGSWKQFLIVAAGLVPAYLLVAMGAARGGTEVAMAVVVFIAGWSLFQVLVPDSETYHMVGAGQVLRAYDELRDVLAAPRASQYETAATEELRRKDTPPLVRFENVAFSYPTSERDVLDGLDLEIRPGELLAIVGMNGAGKSTLIKLLSGLYAPTRGRITVDGTDLARIAPEAWRGKLSVVFQDFVRYQLSIGENVALGQGGLARDQASVEAAAHDAGLSDVLERLPEGWDTPLARSRTGGVDLSGGQWQKVVLARALYATRRGARLLVLDEPTAHLDVRTEFDVFDRLSGNRNGTSMVLISHRLSTVRQADRIVLLGDQRIVESGTHDELMALDGRYAEMFRIQAERFRRGQEGQIEEGTLL